MNNKMNDVSGISPVQRETITQQFDVIRISFNERGIMGVSEHLEELNAIYSAGSDDVIEIRVSGCPGGSADTIQTIIHALIATPAHTVCVLSGTNSSAATMIPLVCSEVITTPYTSMMCHSVSGGNFGTMANQERSAVFFSKLYSDFMEDIYSNFLSPSELDDLKKGLEIYLSAEDIEQRFQRRMELLEAEAEDEEDDFNEEEDSYEITTAPDDFGTVSDALSNEGITFASAEVTMIPQTMVELTSEDDIKKMRRILALLDEEDDVQNVYHNWDEPIEDEE